MVFFSHFILKLEEEETFSEKKKVQGYQVIWFFGDFKKKWENDTKVLWEKQTIESLGFGVFLVTFS